MKTVLARPTKHNPRETAYGIGPKPGEVRDDVKDYVATM